MTRERPILFSAPMVRAILAGTKTQTRRVVKPWNPVPSKQPRPVPEDVAYLPDFTCYRTTCPYGQPGDRLWVRETWQCVREKVGGQRSTEGPPLPPAPGRWIEYLAGPHPAGYELPPRWRPSIHMPRWASRVNLEITGVRVERLQDIDVADALAEGVNVHPDHYGKPRTSLYSPVQAYRDLWESINGPGSWDANPWVRVVEFKRVTP